MIRDRSHGLVLDAPVVVGVDLVHHAAQLPLRHAAAELPARACKVGLVDVAAVRAVEEAERLLVVDPALDRVVHDAPQSRAGPVRRK